MNRLMPTTTAYIRLTSIDHRFEAVIQRNPQYSDADDVTRNCGRVAWARREGVNAAYCYREDQHLFDMYVHHNWKLT